MTALERLIPPQASNDYRGSRIALWAFWIFQAPMVFRGFVHFLKDDAGLNSIASIVTFSGTPDPNRVVYLFGSLWGSQQLIMVGVYLLVLLRYRNLLPLMWGIVIVEVMLRLTAGLLHPLGPEYFAHTPPGAIMNLPLLGVAIVMLVLSLRVPREAQTQAQATG